MAFALCDDVIVGLEDCIGVVEPLDDTAFMAVADEMAGVEFDRFEFAVCDGNSLPPMMKIVDCESPPSSLFDESSRPCRLALSMKPTVPKRVGNEIKENKKY